MHPSSFRFLAGVVLIASFAFAGCANSPAPAATPAVPARFAQLAKGLPASRVRELWGPPATTKPLAAGGLTGEIWSYPLETRADVLSVPVATQSVPAVNPLTGQDTTRAETVYQQQTVKTTETLHLLIVDDRLLEWRIVRDTSGAFH